MTRRSVEDFARFGGKPLFDEARPTGQLYAPSRERFLDRLEAIVTSNRYSNGGPFVSELEERLRVFHGVEHALCFANASFALVAVMRLTGRRPGGEVIVPSFTYRGLPHLIRWSGFEPRFCEVDPATHTLDRTSVKAAGGSDAAAILAVNHVNAPAALDDLAAFSAETRVPVIYDSVYAIAATYVGKPFGRAGVAEVFSLHATKLLNGFEGGYVTTNDDDLAEQLRRTRNFGFDQVQPRVTTLGMNGKLNEVHAAMALGSLEEIDGVLARNRRNFETYRTALAGAPGLRVVDPAPGMEANHEMVLVEVADEAAIDRDAIVELMKAERALCRPYFSPPLHRSPFRPRGVKQPHLPVTDDLARRYFQLPTGKRLGAGDAERIAEALSDAMRLGTALGRRLSEPIHA